MVGCFGFNGPLRQYFSLYRAVSQREGERGEKIDESKKVQTTPTRTYCKRNRLLPYLYQNCTGSTGTGSLPRALEWSGALEWVFRVEILSDLSYLRSGKYLEK